MLKCIYCLRNQTTTSFTKREHVIPRFFGSYEPMSPTIKEGDDRVCDECNKSFSKLEVKFKEDSEEGIFSQLYNLEGKSMARIRNQATKYESKYTKKVLFNEIFPALKRVNGITRVIFPPQIKIKNPDGSFEVYYIDALNKISAHQSKFKELKTRISKLPKTSIFTFVPVSQPDDSKPINDSIDLMKKYGIKYNEKERKLLPPNNNDQFPFSLQCTLDSINTRVLAKIAFNYFAYCAICENMSHILYNKDFNRIRNFINGKVELPSQKVFTSIDRDVILGEEKAKNKRAIAQIVTFKKEGDQIVVQMTFMGGRNYELPLGKFPTDLKEDNFGCGHLFNPFNRQIVLLTQPQPSLSANSKLFKSFGLYKKDRTVK